MDDLFLKIIKGEIPSHIVYEDAHTFAFLDINPVNPGHTLVVPKEQYENIYDIPEDLWCALMSTVKKLAPAIKTATRADGINIEMNNGSAAGQMVFHTHIHIVPRYKNDGFTHWPGTPYKDKEAEQITLKIKESLKK